MILKTPPCLKAKKFLTHLTWVHNNENISKTCSNCKTLFYDIASHDRATCFLCEYPFQCEQGVK